MLKKIGKQKIRVCASVELRVYEQFKSHVNMCPFPPFT